MRLVEVVMLMGAHCVSPVEHSPMMTDAAKVQCAVVIEKDTERGTLTVTPPEAARDPQVAAAVARFNAAPVDALSGGGTRIVPAWAPAGSPPREVKWPVAKVAVAPQPAVPPPPALASSDLDATTPPPAAAPAADKAETAPPPVRPEEAASAAKPPTKLATLSAPPPKQPVAKRTASTKKVQKARPQKAAAAKPGSQCKGAAVAKWYTASDGKKKYRCVKPAGGGAPAQLY